MNLFTKKSILFILGLVLIIFIFQTCKDDKVEKKDNNTPILLNNQEVALKNNATIGEYSKIFRVDKSVKLDNGQYIVLNIENIKKYNEYTSNTNQVLKNVIVIDNVTPANITKVFLDQKAFFSLFDEYGNEDIDIESYVQTGKENTEIILTSKNDINKIKYVSIGGLDSETNDGKVKKLFEIK
jgi:hypothetical protein